MQNISCCGFWTHLVIRLWWTPLQGAQDWLGIRPCYIVWPKEFKKKKKKYVLYYIFPFVQLKEGQNFEQELPH